MGSCASICADKPVVPTTKARIELDEKYLLTRLRLGQGAFAEVVLAEERADRKQKWAVKIIQRLSPSGKTLIDEGYLRTEISILRGLGVAHPHILALKDYYEDTQEVLLVVECAAGGTLLERIDRRGKFSEADASFAVRQLVDAVCFLHGNGVIHRDMKPENILTREGPRADLHVLVADFGISKMFHPEVTTVETGDDGWPLSPPSHAAPALTAKSVAADSKYVMRTVAGSQNYAAPE